MISGIEKSLDEIVFHSLESFFSLYIINIYFLQDKQIEID